jgi:uncharacterized protein (DUF1697 family)
MPRPIRSTRRIAFLRGINVGGHRVKMDRLRDVFETLGFARVETFIASGNVVFDAPAREDDPTIERRIEARLLEALGYEVHTFIRTPAELAAIVGFDAFPPARVQAPDHTLFVHLLREAPSPQGVAILCAYRTPADDLRLHHRELYWLRHGRVSDSLIPWNRLARDLAMNSTARNIATLRAITERWPIE